jgi:hypothetical protein
MSDCGACIGGGDYDGTPEFWNVTNKKAHKAHRCGECQREIPSGSIYESVAGKYDGDFYTAKTCSVCAEIRDAFACDEGAGPAYGQLWYDMTQAFPAITTGCFERLTTPEAKAYLRERWLKWKGIA